MKKITTHFNLLRQCALYLFCFLMISVIEEKNYIIIRNLIISLGSTILVDGILIYLKNKKIKITDSSMVSGVIIATVLAYDLPWWMYGIAGGVAMLSKHIVRVKGKHVFNPAAFGIFIVLFIFNGMAYWNGTAAWYYLIPFIIYFVHKIHKLDIVVSFYATYCIVFGIYNRVNDIPFLPVLEYANNYFMSVMLIEPKTTPIKPLHKGLFGVGSALTVFLLYQIRSKLDPDISSLLIMNAAWAIASIIINEYNKNKGRRTI